MRFSMRQGVIMVLLSTFGYGILPTVSKMAMNAGAATETVIFDKFVIAVVLLWGYLLTCRRENLKLNKTQWKSLILECVFYNVMVITIYEAFEYMQGNLAIAINFMYPALVIIFETVTRKVGMNRFRLIAVILSVQGSFL